MSFYYHEFKDEKMIDEHLNIIKNNIMRRDETIDSLIEENKRLKDEHYKDEELAEMKKQLKTARSKLYLGFGITERESASIAQWKKNHELLAHSNPKQHHGAAGGGYTYQFYPTSIGDFGKIICDTCASRARQIAVVDGKYDPDKYHETMNNWNAWFNFSEL